MAGVCFDARVDSSQQYFVKNTQFVGQSESQEDLVVQELKRTEEHPNNGKRNTDIESDWRSVLSVFSRFQLISSYQRHTDLLRKPSVPRGGREQRSNKQKGLFCSLFFHYRHLLHFFPVLRPLKLILSRYETCYDPPPQIFIGC